MKKAIKDNQVYFFEESDIEEKIYTDNGFFVTDLSEADAIFALNEALRKQRKAECFPIINRGKLWYDALTVEQLSELNDWYHDWLDVTASKTVPTKPTWLEI